MSCGALERALRDHAAGADATPSLTAHLRDCFACAQTLEAERRLLSELDTVLGQVRAAEPPPALLARARSLAARPVIHRPASALWAAAAVLVLSLSALLRPRVAWVPPDPSRPEAPASSLREEQAVVPPVRSLSYSSSPARPQRSSPSGVPFVPPGQEAVVLRFAALLASGVVAMPTQPLAPEGSAVPIPEPPDLERPLLIIEPIEPVWADEAPSEESR